jgi:hypothetical protein
MALTLVQNGMIAPNAVNINNLSTTNNPVSNTILSGGFGWIYQDSHFFDMGQIKVPVNNMVALLLQSAPVDFSQTTLSYDAGSIV